MELEELEENELERALRLAASDPASRPDFFRVLLASTVYVIGEADPPVPENGSPADGAKLTIQNIARSDGSPAMPFFTSLDALRRAVKQELKYMALPARKFFEVTLGATLILNPTLTYGKEFFPDEIDALLTSGVNRLPAEHTMTGTQEVLLGQPANYPDTMVTAIKGLLSKHSEVRAAYLVSMQDKTQDAKPQLVVGIDADDNFEQLVREIGVVAGDTSPAGVPVDLMQVAAGEPGLSDYFINNVTPFYARAPSHGERNLNIPLE